MSNELVVITPRSIEEAERLASTLARAHTLPEALRQKPADILATILTGAELGLAPMQAVRGIQIIKGRPTLSADTMGALVKRRSDVCEYLVLKESTAERAVYVTKRRGDPDATTMTYTIQDAQRAGLVGGDNWRRYPQAMLRARCLSAICRAVYPDLCLGLYDPDEMSEPTDAPAPAAVEKDVTPAPPPNNIPRTRDEARRQLAAAVATINGQHPWERIKRAGLDAGMRPENIAREAARISGKKRRSELTDADVEAFVRWLQDEPVDAEVIPPSDADMEAAANPL